jgi:O-acetylhomoserine/O-acetylserine sulfhydrylase-like pyridoxal-dependent enzyme
LNSRIPLPSERPISGRRFAPKSNNASSDNIVSVSTLYGGTYNLFAHTLPQYGIEVRFADPDSPEQLAGLVDERTRLVFAETLGNPKLNVVDIKAWAEAAHAAGLPLVVDNTVATPILCRVFDHGADVAVHSATKYIGVWGAQTGFYAARLYSWMSPPRRSRRSTRTADGYRTWSLGA